jgi:hypothetical protein
MRLRKLALFLILAGTVVGFRAVIGASDPAAANFRHSNSRQDFLAPS